MNKRALILFIQTLALYKSFTYLLTKVLSYNTRSSKEWGAEFAVGAKERKNSISIYVYKKQHVKRQGMDRKNKYDRYYGPGRQCAQQL